MDYLHYKLDLAAGEMVEITLDKQANVRLVDDENFEKYKRDEDHEYTGGLAKKSPIRLKAPNPGKWHLVIDMGGYNATVKATVRMLKG